jgi:serine phosphatase RsbU (regulator of sigma subunit)
VARTVSIRRSLLTNLVVVVLLLGGTIAALTFLSGRRALRRFSTSLIGETLEHTESRLGGFFDPVTRQLHILQAWADAGLLEGADPDRLNLALAGLMSEHPWITSCMIADDRGREHMLMRVGDQWRYRRVRRDEWGDREVWREWTEESPEPDGYEEALGYDPRIRPWFQGAVETLGEGELGSVHWTEPYSFFTTKDPGITASVAFRGPDGRTRVLGLDVLLTDISTFTTGLDFHGNGKVFVLTDDDRLIGLPRGPRFTGPESFKPALLKRPAELDSPLTRDGSRALLGKERLDVATRFTSAGGAWWGQVRRFDLGGGRHVIIGVAVPESDLLGDLRIQRLWIGLITLVVLGLGVARVVVLAGRYGRPVEELVAESERISQGDLEPGEPIDTRVAEVHRLAVAHDKMRAGLKTLLKVERDLQLARRIQQSTFPKRLPALSGFDLAAWSEPADETGGDTYDVIGVRGASLSDQILLSDENAGRAVLLLADATGHGIGPALSVTQVRAMLRIAVRMNADLARIAREMNDQLCADLPSGRFITAWFGALDSERHSLTSFSAGQGPLLRYEAARDEFHVSKPDTFPMGLFEQKQIDLPKPMVLRPGDIFAVISDGIFEAKGPDDDLFGEQRVMDVIREHRDACADEILTQIRQAVETYTKGAPADDDRTMILIKRGTEHDVMGT